MSAIPTQDKFILQLTWLSIKRQFRLLDRVITYVSGPIEVELSIIIFATMVSPLSEKWMHTRVNFTLGTTPDTIFFVLRIF